MVYETLKRVQGDNTAMIQSSQFRKQSFSPAICESYFENKGFLQAALKRHFQKTIKHILKALNKFIQIIF